MNHISLIMTQNDIFRCPSIAQLRVI